MTTCDHRIFTIQTKGSDCHNWTWPNGEDGSGYAPEIKGLCGGDYTHVSICIDCYIVVGLATTEEILSQQPDPPPPPRVFNTYGEWYEQLFIGWGATSAAMANKIYFIEYYDDEEVCHSFYCYVDEADQFSWPTVYETAWDAKQGLSAYIIRLQE